MKNKLFSTSVLLVFIGIMIVSMFAISTVCAAENVSLDVGSNHSEILTSQNHAILKENEGSFADLNSTIYGSTCNEINLTRDYKYSPDMDSAYNEGINIARTVTINGNGHTIDAQFQSRIFNISSAADNVILNNMSFINGKSCFGGAINWIGSNGAVNNCQFINNWAYGDEYSIKACNMGGGAILWEGAHGTVAHSIFKNNRGCSGGAILWKAECGTIFNSTFTHNKAERCNGGAVRMHGKYGRVGCSSFSDNRAGYAGGAICWDGGVEGYIVNCNFKDDDSLFAVYDEIYGQVFEDNGDFASLKRYVAIFADLDNVLPIMGNYTFNSASDIAGYIDVKWSNFIVKGNGFTIDALGQTGIFDVKGYGVTLNNINFINTQSDKGGAILWKGNCGKVINSTFASNAAGNGGAIYWEGKDGKVINSTFASNAAGNGGAICWEGDGGTVINSTFTNNNAVNFGAAIYWKGINGKITNSTFIKNDMKYGGAVFWEGSSGKIFNSIFTGNTAYTGGAILWKGSGGKITNTVFTDNSARVYEGGAVFWLGADGEIINSSFNGNTAYSFGGAVYVGPDSNLIIDASNFTDNLASSTKDAVYIRQYSKSCIIKNSIFNNSGPYEIYNNKILTLENNTLSKYIYNNGTILSKTYIVMPNNSTVEIYPNTYININNTITDDNGNIIIHDKKLPFLID